MSLSLDQAMIELKQLLPDYIEEFRNLKKSGDNWRINCINPAHEDKNPSCFLLAPAIKDGVNFSNWKFYCQSCGISGDIFNAAALLEEKPIAGHEFLEDNVLYLAEKMKVGEVRIRQLTERERLEVSMYQCMRAAVDVLKDITPQGRNDMDWHVRKYIYDHGWIIDESTPQVGTGTNPGTLNHMGVFWIPSGDLFRERLLALGYTEQFLDRMDLWKRGRDEHPIFTPKNLIFTIYDSKGRPVGFAGRDCTWKSDSEGSKYNNTSASLEGSIYHKRKLLYNMHVAKAKKGATYIFEGYSDVVTARMHGFHNCVAICSSHLGPDQMIALSANGITEIVLAMDGDEVGQKAIDKILDERISGQSDVRCKLLLMPDGRDPDDFIRAEGLDEFFKMRPIDPFEYRLDQIRTDIMDAEDVCKLMIPLIVNEPSSIAQEKMAKILAEHTGFSLQAILQDLSRASNYRDAEREQNKKALLHEALLQAEDNWDAAPLILMDVANKIAQIDSLSKSDSMSNVEFSRAIMEQKETEEERGDEKPGFRLGPMLEILDDRLAGEWPGCLGIIGGRANTGKTTLLTEMALYSVLANEDTVSVILTLDDARRKIIPRLVSLLAYEEFGNIFLNMGMVERPAHWTKQMMGNNAVYEYRDAGYKRLRELVNEGRLIVKDTTHGTSFPYIQALLQHAQHAHPDKQILFWLDSYHKVATTDGSRDREFHVELALIIKNLAKQLSVPFWMNAEYTKLAAGTKPSNTHLAETVKLEYEADVIIHLYNDLHDIGIQSDHFFTYNNKRMPLVEAIFGKNKINDFKESVWLKFYPEYGIQQAIDRETAQAILRTQEPLALEDEDD